MKTVMFDRNSGAAPNAGHAPTALTPAVPLFRYVSARLPSRTYAASSGESGVTGFASRVKVGTADALYTGVESIMTQAERLACVASCGAATTTAGTPENHVVVLNRCAAR